MHGLGVLYTFSSRKQIKITGRSDWTGGVKAVIIRETLTEDP
jgi:hypothetical protein